MHPLASIPSPAQGVWHLGPLPVRAYALMIILGIVVAVWLGERRWTARGGTAGTVIDIAVWAVPFGLLGGRLYHVITDNQLYFGTGKNPLDALKIWNGGLGIWGAVMLGAVGAIIGCRRRGVNVRALADAVAPGIAFAQAFGRWGNWFNQELYGRPLHTFWALKIDLAHRPRLANGDLDPRYASVGTYHPTFLYESLWCVGVGLLVIWAGKRYRLNYGRTFALYVAAYTVGRAWIEWLRIDNTHHFLGLRLNDYTAIVVFLCAVAYLYIYRDRGDVEDVLEPGLQADAGADAAAGADGADGAARTEAEPSSNVRIVAETTEEPVQTGTAEVAPNGEAEHTAADSPATAEPTDTEPVQAEPVQAEPVQAEPVQAAADDTTVEKAEKADH